MSQYNNPNAFPHPGNSNWSVAPSEGMTLRDWFAGQALAGLCANTGSFGMGNGPADLAVRAYDIADCMLGARREGDAA